MNAAFWSSLIYTSFYTTIRFINKKEVVLDLFSVKRWQLKRGEDVLVNYLLKSTLVIYITYISIILLYVYYILLRE